MKAIHRVISIIMLAVIITGCSEISLPPAVDAPLSESSPELSAVELTVRVINASQDGSLLLAAQDSGSVYRSTLSNNEVYPVGTVLKLSCADSFEEVYPKIIIEVYSVQELEDEFNDLCGLYMAVFEDIWDDDPALQADTQYVGVDLSETSLSQSEQEALAWHIGELLEKEAICSDYEELCSMGYINDDGLYWEDGCLLSITEIERDGGELVFDAEKWRSGLGAIFYIGCTAEQSSDGKWSPYTQGAYAIS